MRYYHAEIEVGKPTIEDVIKWIKENDCPNLDHTIFTFKKGIRFMMVSLELIDPSTISLGKVVDDFWTIVDEKTRYHHHLHHMCWDIIIGDHQYFASLW